MRREQTEADRASESRNGLTFADPSEDGVRTAYVRQLQAGGVEAALIPVERFNVGMERLMHKAPPELRPAFEEQRDGLCLWMPDPVDGGDLGCYTTEGLQAGLPAVSSSAPGRRVFYGLVPDGVARVQIDLKNGDRLTAVPRENFYASTTASGPPYADRTRWYDDEGRVVSEVPPGP